MRVPLLDLKPQYASLREEILARVTPLFDSQELILGPTVEAFERDVAAYIGSPYALGCSSGTDALLLALHASEIGPGDAVITSPYSFFATAGSVWRVGAEPVFVDIDPVTFNLDPAKVARFIAEKCTTTAEGALLAPSGKRIRAIMPVHLFGLCADLDSFERIAGSHNLALIEDAAQAIGSQYPSASHQKNVQAGTVGDFGCFSFYPTKNLGAFGDAGLMTCNSEKHFQLSRSLRNHGMETQYLHNHVGGNFRLDAIQAAVLSVKLGHLDNWSAGRRRNAEIYRTLFANRGLTGNPVILPLEPYAESGATNHHIYNQFVIRVPKRDELLAHLRADGIGCAVYYPLSLHLQPCFAALGHKAGDFPQSERASHETLALPIFPELTEEQLTAVVDSIAKFFAV